MRGGVITAVKLDRLVRSELDIDLTESYFWTDNEIVIAYLRNDSKRYKTFVANRVSQIRELTETNQWRHISGKQNPAHMLSRGCMADNVPEIWYHGPVFL